MQMSIQRGMVGAISICAHTTLFVMLSGAVTPAFATDHFNLESGIPTTIEDIEPLDRGSAEFQVFGRFEHMGGRKNFVEAEPRLAFGIFDKTQLEIATPLLLGEGASNGNGDIDVSVLRKLRDDSREDSWPGFALEADLRLPTGIEQQGFKNRIDAGLTALMKKDIGPHSFHVNAGFDWSGDESDQETLRRRVWSAAIGHHTSLTDQLVLVSDMVWRQADDRDAQDIWLVETGVRAQLGREMIGAIGIGAGLNRGPETPVVTLTAGIQIGL
jgi:outer membrane putative beta-barrel porin/alpha-amylase